MMLAPAAMAADGVGLGGRTTDKSVTFFCFGVIALFMILPIVLSLIQAKLEGRKERMREQIERVRRSVTGVRPPGPRTAAAIAAASAFVRVV